MLSRFDRIGGQPFRSRPVRVHGRPSSQRKIVLHTPDAYIAFTIPSTIFFASENSIIVLSRKNSSFSIPA